VTVVGPPPSGEDLAPVVVRVACVLSARRNSSASPVGEAGQLRFARYELNSATSCFCLVPVKGTPGHADSEVCVEVALLFDEPQPEKTRGARSTSASGCSPSRKLLRRLRRLRPLRPGTSGRSRMTLRRSGC